MRGSSQTRSSRRIPRRKATVSVIGLGYVGLPLACLASEKGYRTIGIALNQKKIDLINGGKSPLEDSAIKRWLRRVKIEATTDYAVIQQAGVIVVCVPTPVDHLYNPDLGPIISAARGIAKYLRRGQLVIVESTINPGVCEEVVLPILETSGLKVGRDIFLAHCPERIDPGNKKWNVRNIPRVVGATDAVGLRKAVAFYQSILEAPVRPMKTIKEAEATKIVENSFRDVNIAFVNELAKSFTKLGIDVVDVIEGAKTKPFAFLAHYPGAGVGGHCIPVDPYYLIERAKRSGFDHRFLKLAREINNSMPEYTVDLLMDALNGIGRSVKGTPITLLGLSYKANVADTRESPSFHVIDRLRRLGANLTIFDPYVPDESTVRTLGQALKGATAVVLMTDHAAFRALQPVDFRRRGIRVVIDGKNVWDPEAMRRVKILHRGIGR